ncbi:hypothetical protein LOTGIDRAFT_228016 [Lottia gigantea]|uniref:EGF-like domain-containing protein n=1 Tax=Lottia gigantea TaxID=225164 RepID=V4AML5_LOTGI|nr:hypothetical protein LOTGIDRAFT_228016 [Lottia gigantea]ESP05419.1 hypothetical protein LOTGIDRAFT_228016 [Lottia gigantea]
MYGQNCSTKCGNCYNEEQCDPITGDCPNGCSMGFGGDSCSFDNTVMVLIIRAFIIAGSIAGGIYIIVMIFCTVMCVGSRRKTKREMYMDDSPTFEDENVPPVQMRRGTGRDGIFMTHLNSLMNLGQTPKGQKTVTKEATFRLSRENNLYASSGPSWRDSEFSVLSDNNYINMKSGVGPPRTSGGLIYANGILIDQNSAPPRGSYGDILNQYVNLKRGPSSKNVSQDVPPSYSDAIYQNSAITNV